MQKMDHPNIIKFNGVSGGERVGTMRKRGREKERETEGGRNKVYEDLTNLYIVMELCRGGELFDRISKRGQYTEKDAAKVLRQIFEGIKYMHSKNVSFFSKGGENGRLSFVAGC